MVAYGHFENNAEFVKREFVSICIKIKDMEKQNDL